MSVPWLLSLWRRIDTVYAHLRASPFQKKRGRMSPKKLLGGIFFVNSLLIPVLGKDASAQPPKKQHFIPHSINKKNLQKPPISPKIIQEKKPEKSYHQLSLNERLTLIENQLQTASTEHETKALWERAENLRFHSLNAASRLLIDEAETQAQTLHISEAIDALNSAIALQPENALLHRKRAAIRLVGNDPLGGIDDLAFTLHEDSRDPTAWLLLAQAENIIHNDHVALSAFQKALKNAPYLPQKDTMLKELKKKAYGQED